jgi:hypothetical protein
VGRRRNQMLVTRRQPGGFGSFLREPRMGKWLLGTVLCWLVFDFAYYGNSISAPEVLALLARRPPCWTTRCYSWGPSWYFPCLGTSWRSCLWKAGRKSIQVPGFGLMTVAFGLIAVVRRARLQPKPARFRQAQLEDFDDATFESHRSVLQQMRTLTPWRKTET